MLQHLGSNISILGIPTNCTQEAEVDEAVQKTVDTFGRLDHACNAAGIAGDGGITTEQTTENFHNVLDLNIIGLWYCERAEIRQMLKQDRRDVM